MKLLLTLFTLILFTSNLFCVELYDPISLSIKGDRFGRARPTVFNPLFYKPALWLDASDASTITESGNALSVWADKSGNGNNATQSTDINKPTTGSETLNGLNVISGDGNDVLTFNCTIDPKKPIYVFQVTKFKLATDVIFDLTGTSIRLLQEQNTIGRDNGAGLATKSVSPTTLNIAIVCTAIHLNLDSVDFFRRENGVQTFNDTTGSYFENGTLTTGYIFDDSTGGNAINGGYIAEYIVYNPENKFSEYTIRFIERYLLNKWGLK